MLTVSAEFSAALASGAEQNIRLEFASGAVIDKAHISASVGVEHMEILNGTDDMMMGSAVESTFRVALLNSDGFFDGFDFEEEFTAKYGVKVGDSFEYIPLGVFRGDRPERIRTRVIDFTAADRMILFDRDASGFIESLTFPVTLGGIYTDLCEFIGVTPADTAFTNSGKTFDRQPFTESSHTCREVLAWIAEAACSYAKFGRDGMLYLVWFESESYNIPKSQRFELTQSEFFALAVDRLEVYTSYSDMLNTAGAGDNLYQILDNPFLYAENDSDTAALQPYVDAIFAKLQTLPAYPPSTFRAISNPAVECGDIITVVSDDGTSLPFPVFMQTLHWSAKGKTEYENTGNLRRETLPAERRELSNLKKSMLKTSDLTTAIDSYINSAEGRASIVQTVSGEFVDPETLSEYVTNTKFNQAITRIDAEISLEASYGSGTIGSNVRAMLTLFANADSSNISLKANAIDLSGYVTITSLSTSGATKINADNITTGTISADRIDTSSLYVRKIYGEKSTDYEDIAIVSSSGRNIAIGNGGTTGLATNLTVWANNISFASKNSASAAEYLVISTVTTTASIDGISYQYPQCIYPFNAQGSQAAWIIGNEDYPFNAIYLDRDVYYFDRTTGGWTRLWVNNNHLYFTDTEGVRNTIV